MVTMVFRDNEKLTTLEDDVTQKLATDEIYRLVFSVKCEVTCQPTLAVI